MNRLVDEIATQLMAKEIQDYQIDILLGYLGNTPFSLKDPLKIAFSDETSTDITIETLRSWVKVYGSSPTVCKTKDEYEKKLLAMRI